MRAIVSILLLMAVGVRSEELLPEYHLVRNLAGTIRIDGSATVGMLVESWAKPLKKLHGKLKIDRSAFGTEVAMDALISGRCELAAMSRRANEEEIARFKKRFGHAPTAVVVAFDAIGIYVHKDNPIKGLTVQQLDSLFSSERRRGGPRVTRWGDLDLAGDWKTTKILFFGFGPNDGAHAWMRSYLLKGAPFRGIISEQPGAGGLVTACGAERAAIGYASQFYLTRRTRLVPIAAKKGEPFYSPSRENCLAGKYPLARELLFYVNREPGKKLPPNLEEYLALATSELGQRFVDRAGSYRIDMKTARANLVAIGRSSE